MTLRSSRLGVSALLVLVLSVPALPAYATHTSAHTAEEIWAVEAQAEQDMDDVVSGFADEISGLGTSGEVGLAETQADDAVVAIWSVAKTEISDLVKLYPGSLGKVGGDAKQQLLNKRNQIRNQIADLADAWVPPPASTTTSTTSTSTTTTGISTTSTTTPGHGTTTTTANSVTTTTTTAVGGSGVAPPPPGNGDASREPPVSPDELGATPLAFAEGTVLAQTPAQVPRYDTVQVLETTDSTENEVTQHMSAMLETVLPPAAVEMVLSPLLILEILIRTSLSGGKGILVPLSSLAVCSVLIYVADRFSRTTTRASRPVVGNVT